MQGRIVDCPAMKSFLDEEPAIFGRSFEVWIWPHTPSISFWTVLKRAPRYNFAASPHGIWICV
jgi:hypothetical protein